jgi:hypothetical protein
MGPLNELTSIKSQVPKRRVSLTKTNMRRIKTEVREISFDSADWILVAKHSVLNKNTVVAFQVQYVHCVS